MEDLSVDTSVRVRAGVPDAEERVCQGICDDLALGGLEVEAVVFGVLVVLGREEAEMLPEEVAAERRRETTGWPGLAVHLGWDGGSVFDDHGDFRVVVADL